MTQPSPAIIPEDNIDELYDNAPCGYLSTLPDGTIVRVNQTFLSLTGHERDHLLAGRRFQELMTLPGRVFYDTHFAPLIRMCGFAREIACDFVRPGREPLPALVNATQVLDANGKPSFLRFAVADATERRRYELDLIRARERAEHFGVIVKFSADAILSIAPDGTLLTWNAAAERMFGHSAAEAIGAKVWTKIFFNAEPGDFRFVMNELRAGNSVDRTVDIRARNGRLVNASILLTPHIEAPAEMTSFSAIIRDLTERRAAEEAQQRQVILENIIRSQESERHRIARDLHDHLGQQLTGLRLALEDLKAKTGANADFADRIGDIHAMAGQMDRDLSFLAFELRSTAVEELGLASAIENFSAEWADNYGIEVHFHGTDTLSRRLTPEIEGNLYRMIQEALNNIRKHAGTKTVSVLFEIRGDDLSLIIEDDGVGFAPDDASLRSEGTGHSLGLLGMKERAAILGGSMQIESTVGNGTSIFIRVPAQYVDENAL